MTYDMTYDTFLEHLAVTPRDWYVHNFGVYSAIRTMSNDQCPLMVVCGGLVSTTIYKSVIRDVNSYIVRAADEGPHRLQALDDDTLTLSIRADLLKACGLIEETENND